MKLTQQHIQTGQGAFFLIDHIGNPPPGMNFRHFTDQAIVEHLNHHSYYYQQYGASGPENRKLVTRDWMRKYLKRMREVAEKGFYSPKLQGDDSADTLFRKRTTEGFSRAVLSRYEYDKTTFRESDLPDYEKSASEVGCEEEGTAEGQAPADERNVGRSRHQLGVKKEAAPHSPPLSKNPDGPFTSTQDDTDGLSSEASDDDADHESIDDEEDGKDRYFDGNEYLDNETDNSGVQVVIKTTAASSARVTPASAEKVDSEVEAIEHVVAKSEIPKKRSRPTQQSASALTQPAHTSLPSAAGSLKASQMIPRTSFVHTAQKQSAVEIASETAPLSLPRNLGSTSQGPRLPDSGEEAFQAQVRSWAKPVKRRHEDVDFDSMINSSEDEATTRSAKRKYSKLAIKADPKPASHDTAAPSAASPSKPTCATSAPAPTDATPHGRGPRYPGPAADEIRDSQSSQQTVPSQLPETRHQPAPFKSDEQARNFENFYQRILVATDQVVASIGDLGGSLSSLDPKPSDRLEALYKRCWGPHWEIVRLKLTKDYVFTVPEVTMSLIAAFIHDNVFNQYASTQEVQAKQLELRGTTGRAILRILDLKNQGQRLAEVVRTIESEDARVRLAQDDKVLQDQLHAKAEKYTQELWSIILPHFRSLSRLAQGHGLSTPRSEREWLAVFEPAITELIKAILRFRLELLATGCEHVYTWPDTSMAYDLREMDIHGGKMQSPLQVLFTVSPGLKVVMPGSTTMRAMTGTKAMVKVRKT